MDPAGSPPPNQDVVLITGASTGLGLATAKLLLAETDHRLVLTARPSSIQRFADAGFHPGARVMIRPLDVRDEVERKLVVEEVADTWGGVDVLINNAGIAYRSVLEHVNEAERVEQILVNFRAPIALAALVLPHMRRQRRGRILNVSSVGGMMAMPTMSIYSASKFALEGASEALWYEVRPWGVQVSLIEPGFVHSDSFEHTLLTVQGSRSIADHFDPYHAHYEHMSGFIARLMRFSWSTPDTVARVVLRTMHRRRAPLRVPATPDAHLFAILRRMLPRELYQSFLYRCLPGIGKWGPAWEARAALEPIPTDDDPTMDLDADEALLAAIDAAAPAAQVPPSPVDRSPSSGPSTTPSSGQPAALQAARPPSRNATSG